MNTSIKSFASLIFFLCLSVLTFAQKNAETVYEKPDVPIDESTKKITYTKVVDTEGTAAELFRKGLEWYNTYYVNPSNVIKEKDPNKQMITGLARIKILNPADKKGIETMKGIVMYTITTEYKDGRFKYTATDIHLKSQSYFACEIWLDTESQTYSQVYNYFLKQVHEQISEAVSNLEVFMTKAPDEKKEDW